MVSAEMIRSMSLASPFSRSCTVDTGHVSVLVPTRTGGGGVVVVATFVGFAERGGSYVGHGAELLFVEIFFKS